MKQELIINKHTPFSVKVLESGDISIQFNQTIDKGNFLYCQSPTSQWVCLLEKVNEEKTYYYASFNLKAGIFNANNWFRTEYIKRIATNTEKKILIQAIQDHGYIWDSTITQLTEKEDKAKVPDNIRIYQLLKAFRGSTEYGDGLFIGSPDGKQLLCTTSNGYTVINNSDSLFERVLCRKIPCEYKDLKHGDTAYKGSQYSNPNKLNSYCKITNKGHISIDGNVTLFANDDDYLWSKIVPIE